MGPTLPLLWFFFSILLFAYDFVKIFRRVQFTSTFRWKARAYLRLGTRRMDAHGVDQSSPSLSPPDNAGSSTVSHVCVFERCDLDLTSSF
ncbi:hypothetical protein MPTK1_8g00655 [Marchantia polymorpha subsp. ruderalis]